MTRKTFAAVLLTLTLTGTASHAAGCGDIKGESQGSGSVFSDGFESGDVSSWSTGR